jgi:hypothetical protein
MESGSANSVAELSDRRSGDHLAWLNHVAHAFLCAASDIRVDALSATAAIRALLNSPPEKQADMPNRRVEKTKKSFVEEALAAMPCVLAQAWDTLGDSVQTRAR